MHDIESNPFCEQYLSSAAYNHHVNESVCPKKPQLSPFLSAEPDSDSSFSLSSENSVGMESSFFLDSSEKMTNLDNLKTNKSSVRRVEPA